MSYIIEDDDASSPIDNLSDSDRQICTDGMWNIFSSGYMNHSNDDGSDDDGDDLSIVSMESTTKKAMAVTPIDQTVETGLSDELMKLSMNDRNAIEEEVHGVASEFKESPQFLERCLHEFDKELMTVKNSDRRRRKLERIHEKRNSSKSSSKSNSNNVSYVDVLKNVIRTTPDVVKAEVGEHAPTSSATATPINLSPQSSESFENAHTRETSEDESKKACYVNDPDVRIRFLRAERYNPKIAVKRFVNFLDLSQELYGDFVADRPILLSDLKTREEKRTLANVLFQFLPFRDRSGRRVFVAVGTCGYEIPPLLRVKVFWYMYWVASEDIESQQKGVLVVAWPSDCVNKSNVPNDDGTTSNDSGTDNSDYSVWQEMRPKLSNLEGYYQMKVMNGLPIRIAAVHFCFADQPIFRIVVTLFFFAASPELRTRFKIHIGEPIEIRYELKGYGIPVDLFPLTHTMTLKRNNHLQWIAFRKFIERQDERNPNRSDSSSTSKKNSHKSLQIRSMNYVECPRSYDVIFGKAKYINNPGNIFYRGLIEDTHDEHAAMSKRDKVDLTWRTLRQIEGHGGRFLEFNKSQKAWVEILDRNVMRQKVAQSYKEFKRNSAVIRSKRNITQHDHMEAMSFVKRQKTVVPMVLNKNWFASFCSNRDCSTLGCNNGCNKDDDGAISTSIFTNIS